MFYKQATAMVTTLLIIFGTTQLGAVNLTILLDNRAIDNAAYICG
jgi:hypothetical protein